MNSENARKKKEDELIKVLGLRTLKVATFNRFECKISAEDAPDKKYVDNEDILSLLHINYWIIP